MEPFLHMQPSIDFFSISQIIQIESVIIGKFEEFNHFETISF